MKKYLKKYKSKVKKLLYLLPIFIVCFTFVFSIPSSALTSYYMSFDKPSADEYSGYMEVTFSDGGAMTYFFRCVSVGTAITYLPYGEVNVTSSSISVDFNFGGDLGVGHPGVVLLDGFMATSGYYNIDSGLYTEDITVNCYIDPGITVKKVKLYGFLRASSSISSSFISGSADWVVSYGSDSAITNLLTSIIGVLQQQNSSIIDNANQNADEIQANADKNAAEIQANADKNTEEITQGGTDYGTVDKEQSDDYLAKEEALNNATSESQENAVSLFSGFGSFFTASKLAKGLTGATRIITDFLQINWLSDMANFGLILGAFSFVIGAGMLLGGIRGQRVSAERRKVSEARSRERSQYYKTQSAYYRSHMKK